MCGNLAAEFAGRGMRTLMIDADPQGSLYGWFRIHPDKEFVDILDEEIDPQTDLYGEPSGMDKKEKSIMVKLPSVVLMARPSRVFPLRTASRISFFGSKFLLRNFA